MSSEFPSEGAKTGDGTKLFFRGGASDGPEFFRRRGAFAHCSRFVLALRAALPRPVRFQALLDLRRTLSELVKGRGGEGDEAKQQQQGESELRRKAKRREKPSRPPLPPFPFLAQSHLFFSLFLSLSLSPFTPTNALRRPSCCSESRGPLARRQPPQVRELFSISSRFSLHLFSFSQLLTPSLFSRSLSQFPSPFFNEKTKAAPPLPQARTSSWTRSASSRSRSAS